MLESVQILSSRRRVEATWKYSINFVKSFTFFHDESKSLLISIESSIEMSVDIPPGQQSNSLPLRPLLCWSVTQKLITLPEGAIWFRCNHECNSVIRSSRPQLQAVQDFKTYSEKQAKKSPFFHCDYVFSINCLIFPCFVNLPSAFMAQQLSKITFICSFCLFFSFFSLLYYFFFLTSKRKKRPNNISMQFIFIYNGVY